MLEVEQVTLHQGWGKITVFNTWLVLSSPLCPGGGGGAWLQMTEA